VRSETRSAIQVSEYEGVGGGAARAGIAGGALRVDAVGVGAGCAARVERRRGYDGSGAGHPCGDAGDAGDPAELHAEAEYAPADYGACVLFSFFVDRHTVCRLGPQ